MDWIEFHHPDISWPVIRRRAGVEIMEMLDLASTFLTRGGWGLLNQACYPNQAAFLNATSRLRKSGLIVKRSEGAKTPELILSDTGKGTLPDYFTPEIMWKRKWNGIWYLLIYDVPEVDRRYRNVLRQFLKRMRMGCLQQSVWVTPQDIRPDFEDLTTAANLDAFAYLFEAKTVLGLSAGQVVEDAWNFDRLYLLQEHYCSVMEGNIDRLGRSQYDGEELAALMRMALEAYHSVFSEDPLLPTQLYPSGYQGKTALSLHRKLLSKVSEQFQCLSSD